MQQQPASSKALDRIWGVAYERLEKGEWVGIIEHLHADTVGQARAIWIRTHSRELRSGRIHLVCVSKPVAFFALDDNGDKASLDQPLVSLR